MSDRFPVLTSAADLEVAVAGSFVRPALFFKHSLTCGTSAWALEELEALLDGPPLSVDVCVVHVQTSRALSNAIAERFGVRHESPQALLVRDGQIIWHASHHRLTRSELAAAIERCFPVGLDTALSSAPQ
jgi:bacillithiol system protein YtxJ